VHLIARPGTLDEAAEAQIADPSPAMALARRAFGLSLCDLSKSYSPLDQAVLAAADRVLLVTDIDVVALRTAVRLLESFRQWGLSSERIELAASGSRRTAAPAEVARAEAALGRPIRWRLPHEPAAGDPARASGLPLVEVAPRCPLAMVYAEMALTLVSELVPRARAR
jgi:pilus assembly protein CpaE